MAAVNFPNSPVDGDTFTYEGKTFTWDNTNSTWVRNPSGPDPDAPDLSNFATTGKAIAMAIVFGG
jgi:hypothetical protein